jgi:hypothetical protein
MGAAIRRRQMSNADPVMSLRGQIPKATCSWREGSIAELRVGEATRERAVIAGTRGQMLGKFYDWTGLFFAPPLNLCAGRGS